MNRIGRIFSVTIWGESHGPMVGLTIDGCPPGIELQSADFETAMARRSGGNQVGTTPRKEQDSPIFLSGLFDSKTTGAPITIGFNNTNTDSAIYTKQRAIPRPGHADWVASQKFGGFEDYRGGGHFSGRLTACLVSAGVVADKLLQSQGNLSCRATLLEAGGSTEIEQAVLDALQSNDSIGGLVECRVSGMPAGWGEPFFDSMESVISHAVFSIPAIKAIEFGAGFAAARMTGSQHNDAIIDSTGVTATNHAGGINGGISNGNELVFRVAVKPPSSTPARQESFNTETGLVESFTIEGRHDRCIALRVPVVLEAVTAIVLADFLLIRKTQQ